MWTHLHQLPTSILEQLCFIHDPRIPVEVRQYLGKWIEDRLRNAKTFANDPNTMYEVDASTFYYQLVQELQNVSANLSTEAKRLLDKTAVKFCDSNSSSLINLYINLVHYLQRKRLNTPSNDDSKVHIGQEINLMSILNGLEQLQTMVRRNQMDTDKLCKECGSLEWQMNELQRDWVQLDAIPNKEIADNVRIQLTKTRADQNNRIQLLNQSHKLLIDAFWAVIHKAEEVHKFIIENYLTQWKRNQLFGIEADISSPVPNVYNLNEIQTWFENISTIICNTKDQMFLFKNKALKEYTDQEGLSEAMPYVCHLFRAMLGNAFIVEKEPPQIIKINTRFTTKVRLLMTTTLITLKMGNPFVNVMIVSENEAQNINVDHILPAGEIENDCARLEYNATTNILVATFNLRLRNIKRGIMQKDRRVMDEKFALLFLCRIPMEDQVFTLLTFSLPVVVIVHGSQEELACATIIWDNVCAFTPRQSFEVPTLLPWNRLVKIIDNKFRSTAGGALTEDNLEFLYQKLFGRNQTYPVSDDQMITFFQFCKNRSMEHNHTFWEWVYAVLKLTREHLSGPWGDKRIIGFIHKAAIEKCLANCSPGTFLLRFTESVLGGISIACVHEGEDGQRQILHVQPFTSKDLARRSLADRILDLEELTHLYPNIPKREAFSCYTKNTNTTCRTTGYVPTAMRTVLKFPPPIEKVDVLESTQSSDGELAPSSSENIFTNLEMPVFEIETINLFSFEEN
uniref:Signal transducer and activator of transcription n=1 Tax=Anopheles epiroticus TaxID=199890 RepID=A0A1E1MX08_9DIPT|nr:TPA_inf: signal transducer and activator of transcription B [Anopheles epiroticus]